MNQTGIMEVEKDQTEEASEKQAKKHSISKQIEELKKLLDEQENGDMKLQVALDFMEQALSQSGTPQFKNFWDARKLCIELFKETISPGVRAHMWAKYGELTKQARALKEILDEQSSFAVEQIEIAVTALEDEIKAIANTPVVSVFEAEKSPEFLQDRLESYSSVQHELNLLNASASRVNSLRKELIKTEMRIRHKNGFFQRLSKIGDDVFPRRKELIKEISSSFQEDVELFEKKYFSSGNPSESLFVLRDEIKKMQAFAKKLTLNTQSFSATRLKLSECWDQVKGLEKEWKKDRAEKKAVFQENAAPILEQIQALNSEFQEGSLTLDQASSKVDSIAREMRQVELGRDEVKELKDKLHEVRKQVQSKQQEVEAERKAEREARNKERLEKYEALKQEIRVYCDEKKDADIPSFEAGLQDLKEKVKGFSLNKAERMELDPLFRTIQDTLSQKREASLLNLSEGDRDALENYKQVLAQRIERRREIKEQLESLRKAAGSSSLDFEQQMNVNQQIEAEKLRLAETDASIVEIEKKLNEIKTR